MVFNVRLRSAQLDETSIVENIVYVDALGKMFSGVSDALYRQHRCNDSYAMLSLSRFPMCALIQVFVFGEARIATVPMGAAVRNHSARVFMIKETYRGGTALAFRGNVIHKAAYSDFLILPLTSCAPVPTSSM